MSTTPYNKGESIFDRLKTVLSIEQASGILKPGDTTPSVDDLKIAFCLNTSPVTVTRFDGGQEGQVLSVVGDGFTTIDHYAGAINAANGAKIRTNTAAAELLSADTMYAFACVKDRSTGVVYWVEQTGSGGGGGGGGGLTFAEAMSISSLGG